AGGLRYSSEGAALSSLVAGVTETSAPWPSSTSTSAATSVTSTGADQTSPLRLQAPSPPNTSSASTTRPQSSHPALLESHPENGLRCGDRDGLAVMALLAGHRATPEARRKADSTPTQSRSSAVAGDPGRHSGDPTPTQSRSS